MGFWSEMLLSGEVWLPCCVKAMLATPLPLGAWIFNHEWHEFLV